MNVMEFEEADLEDVLDELIDYNLSSAELAKYVIDSYAKTFAVHFPKASATDFVQYTHELLDLLEDLIMFYPQLKLTIKTITSMIDKFISHETKGHNTTK